MYINNLIDLLSKILVSYGRERINIIQEFQNKIWKDTSIDDEKLNDILSDIAYILDFYEPNDEWRKASPNYYGDERLEEVIKSGIYKIEEYIKNLNEDFIF